MNISETLWVWATRSPEAPAVIDTRRGRSRSVSFAELDLAAARAAGMFLRAGLRPGDPVLILGPMSAELYVALVAVFRLGLTAVFLDPSARREHIERCCRLCPPRAFIASATAHLLSLFSRALRRIPVKFCIGPPIPGTWSWSRADRLAPHEPIRACAADTPALLTFTSGSTGNPKAAVRTHGFLLAQHRAMVECLGLRPGEVDLTALPIVILANLASGVASLIPDADLRHPGSIDPAPVLAQIRAHHPSRAIASPAFLERLANHCLERGLTLPGLQRIFSGGAPVLPRLLDKLHSVAPGADITAVYGSTEAEPIASIQRREIVADGVAPMLGGRGLLAGYPVPTIQLRILPSHWGRPLNPYTRREFVTACLPPGEPGEIVVSGSHVLPGYLHGGGDEETKFTVEATPWHRTGDAGYLDDRGRLWLLGRCAASIRDGRGVLYPFSVECIANHHPGVRQAALVSRNGRRILAIEFEDRTSDTDLTSLRHALAWAHLDELHVCPYIPVDARHNAKIDYPALHRQIGPSGRARLRS
jgi:acyl-CoA synthetase (AMP-forming)/AMP-acid ligase II